ncbi:hypothetical protein HK104_008464 [Borealophlyctis nickersoniae]|nr:hypothetical protein HK104_008464 [Borealophlyctis nickersoniae]
MAKEKSEKVSTKKTTTGGGGPQMFPPDIDINLATLYTKTHCSLHLQAVPSVAELPKVKAANPGIQHKEAFKKAASNWKNSPDNPINKK